MPETKLATPTSIAVDLVLVAAFFALLFKLLGPHVPSSNPAMITLWAGLSAACMSTTFWLVIQMFRLVLRAQRERDAKQ